MLTQSPLQSVSPAPHEDEQTLPEQTGVEPEQVVLHVPQCVLSLTRSTQTPLQFVWPGPQHLPSEHD